MPSTVLNFILRADTSQATAEIKRGGAAIAELGDKTTAVGQQFEVGEKNFLRVAKSLGVDLTSASERTIAKLEGLRTHLVSINAPAADIERVTNSLTAAQARYSDSLQTAAEKSGGFWQQHGAAVAQAASAIGAALIGIGTMAVQAFAESERVGAQLNAVLKSTGGAAGVTREQVLALSDSLSKMTGIDDEAITSSQAMLLTFTDIGKSAFPAATKAALDMATAMNGGALPSAEQLRGTSIQLGKALQDPVDGLTALKRVGVNFDEQAKNTIKAMVEMGDKAGAQKLILAELTKEFGGSAEAAGNTFAGAMAKAKVEAGNLQEDLGSKLVPQLTALAKEFPGAATAVLLANDAFGKMNLSMGDLLIAVPVLKIAFPGLAASIGALGGAAGPIALVTVGIAALTATVWAGVEAYKAYKNEQVSLVQAQAGALKATVALQSKVTQYHLEVERGTDSQEKYNARLFRAIADYELLNRGVNKSLDAHMKLNTELPRTKEQLEKEAQAAAKAKAEHDRLASALGITTVKTLETVLAGQKEIASMERSGVATQTVTAWKDALSLKMRELLGITQKVDVQYAAIGARLDENVTPAVRRSIAAIDTGVASLERLGLITIPKAVDGLKQIDEAFRGLGVSTDLSLRDQAEKAERWYNTIRDSGVASAREIQLAEAAAIKSQIDLMRQMGQEIPPIMQKTVDDINSKWGNVKDVSGGHIKSLGDIWRNQVSTIVTDFSKGVADILFEGGSFKDKMVAIFKEAGKSIVRTFIESGINKLLAALGLSGGEGGGAGGGGGGGEEGGGLLGKLESGFKNAVANIGSFFKDMFGKIGSFFSSLIGSVWEGLKGLGAGAAGIIGGLGLGATGLLKGNTPATIGGGAIAGFSIGNMILPGIGGAIGAGIGALAGWVASWFGKDKDKIADTALVEAYSGPLWALHAAYQSTPFVSTEADAMNRAITLQAGIGAWNTMVGQFKRPESADSQRQYIMDFINAINKDFSIRTGGAPVPDLPIQPLAEGGIVTRPTLAMIGEAGPEAVIPLGRGSMGLAPTLNFYITSVDSEGMDRVVRERVIPALTRAWRNNYRGLQGEFNPA